MPSRALTAGILVALLSVAILLALDRIYASKAATTVPAASTTATSSQQEIHGRIVVILGTESCPHCRAMEAFFREELPGRAYFCEITEKGSSCEAAFGLLVSKRVTMAVPTMVVCDTDRRVVEGIIIGEFRDAKWWRNVLENGLPGGNETSIPVYMVDRVTGAMEVEPRAMEKLYSVLCNATLADAKPLG
ncbi:hypothetical protein [Pyrodictium abyssi]|uniref:Thioredoxin-like fold domain-containing protein n=1 Tax=Pyrodictium abyssi TaxID=54256 RepID=A0ABM8ISK1_9CREN|nr:hypothetical protein PABY_01150 [Pyrodictium abyssi]